MKTLTLNEDFFGELIPYIKNNDITDINWNGRNLWIEDLKKGRYKESIVLSEQFVESFSTRIANLTNTSFNKFTPVLEGETDQLRISVIHEDITNTGRSISIRKTPAIRRITKEKMYEDRYCDPLIDSFMQACIAARSSIIVAGTPGTGKTEYVKYLTQYIPERDRTITIEDNSELRYALINPNADSVELKVDEDFSYTEAIKVSLRQFPNWILLSEARSREASQLLECASVGTSCITTIHTNNVRKIPDRIRNMLGNEATQEKINDLYNFFDIGVLITKDYSSEKINRSISQVCVFSREKQVNEITIIYEDGKFTGNPIPEKILTAFKLNHIQNPLGECYE